MVRDVDLSKVTGGSGIQSALPDWAGRIWFVTVSGVVGFVTPKGAVRDVHLPKGETIANSFSMDESGGVFIVSTHALYRFDVRRGRPRTTWRKPYDRGSRVKPGQVSQGSGTTPTLVGRASSRGGGSIAITDNADPRMNVLVFRRGKAGPGPQAAVPPAGLRRREERRREQPDLRARRPGRGEQLRLRRPAPGGSLRPLGDHRARHGQGRGELPARRLPRRLAQHHRPDPHRGGQAEPPHRADLRLHPPQRCRGPARRRPRPTRFSPEAWFFTAFSARTGKQVWSKYTGSGLGFNNNYAPVSLGPDGTAYVGTLGGLIRVADTH